MKGGTRKIYMALLFSIITQLFRRAPIPGPTSFATSLAAYFEKVIGTCPICDHDEDIEASDDEEEEIDEIFVMTTRLSLLLSEQIYRNLKDEMTIIFNSTTNFARGFTTY
jgi:hypothetical protein